MQFPQVFFLVCQVLGIVGFQIETQQIFNVIGIITNLRWSRLGIDNLNHLVLVIKNWPHDVYVGCDGGKAKNLHDYLQAEQIMIEEHNKIIEEKKFFLKKITNKIDFEQVQIFTNFFYSFCVGLYGLVFCLHVDIVWVEFQKFLLIIRWFGI